MSALFWVACFGLLVAGKSLCGKVSPNEKPKISCKAPFLPIGDRCLVIDNTILMSWMEVRNFCQQLEGDIVNMHDANILYDIASYLKDTGITKQSFWIGAYDLLEEGHWVWSYNNSDVHMNTPLWGVRNGAQEPTGGLAENCAMLNTDYYYFVFDEDCNKPFSAICSAKEETLKSESKSDDSEIKDNIQCPYPFTMMGGSCLMVDAIQPSPWFEQQVVCQRLGGHLAKLDDANDFAALSDYLKETGTKMSLWLGGSDSDEEGHWVWHDGTDVKMGTPFWGESMAGTQEPAGGARENCLALAHEDFFFFHDQDCNQFAGVLCQFDV